MACICQKLKVWGTNCEEKEATEPKKRDYGRIKIPQLNPKNIITKLYLYSFYLSSKCFTFLMAKSLNLREFLKNLGTLKLRFKYLNSTKNTQKLLSFYGSLEFC